MKILLVWLLVCCVVNCSCRVVSGDFSEQAARLLRAVRLPCSRRALVPVVLEDVRFVLHSIFPGCTTELYGSVAAGVGLMASDLDVSVTLSHKDPTKNATRSQLVMTARDIVLQYPALFHVIKAIPTALIPILKLKHLPTGFKLDVSFDNLSGIQNSKLIFYLVSLDERARDLSIIAKYWARLHGVTGHTMLPSYGVVTMMIFFLQQREILPSVAFLQKNTENHIVINGWNMSFVEEKYANKNNETLCSLLGGFFRYYTVFDYNKFMASPYIGRPIEFELFKNVNTVPEEFAVYKHNVFFNISRPLNIGIPLIQDSFEHNTNLAYRITKGNRKSIVARAFQDIAESYREGCSGFLEAILGGRTENNSVSQKYKLLL